MSITRTTGLSNLNRWLPAILIVSFGVWSPLFSPLPAQTTDAPKSTATTEADSRTPAAEDDSDREESWSVVYMGAQRVGYGRVVVDQIERDGKEIVVADVEENIAMKRFGQQITIKVKSHSEETPAGDLLSFWYEMQNPPAGSTRYAGMVDGNRLKLEVTVNGETKPREIAWNPAIKSSLFHDRAMRESPMKPGDSLSFETFSPELCKVVTMKIVADDYRTVKLHDGSERELLKIRTTTSALPGIGMRSYLDEHGDSLRTEADLLGMVTYSVPRDVALQQIAGAELDVAVNTLIKVENPPARLHSTSEVVYRITTKGRDPSQFIPAGATQSVKKIDDETVELTVTALRLPMNIQPSGTEEDQYLGATTYLQSDDYNVKEHARKAAGASTDPGRIAAKMEEYVYSELKKKNFSTALASAAEVAKNMEGDCTEHACLLAAMLRSRGIPSRVVVGLVYAAKFSAFGGHMWTEAWLDGQWVPLDATLGSGGIGGGHIKLGDSNMSDEGPAPVSSFLPLMNLMNDVTIEIVSSRGKQ